MSELSEEEIDQQYDLYLNERKFLIQTEYEQATTLDKAILTISTGVFGLTIAFIDNMIITLNKKWILGVSWSLFAWTILVTLYSFFFSQKAMRRQIEINEKNLLENGENNNDNNCWGILTAICNNIAIISLTFAIGMLAIFVVINI